MKDILKKTRCPHDIAEQLDISLSKAKRLVKDCDYNILGWGSQRMQKHLISRKNSGGSWPDGDRIHHHRKLHDQGRVTLCQGKDGDFCLLYAVPNNPPVRREPYFYAERGY